MTTTNGHAPAYIPDGYTRPAFIAEVPRLYPAVRIVFRPLLVAERRTLARLNVNAKNAQQEEVNSAMMLAKNIKSWSILDDKDEPLPITTANLLKIQPMLADRIFGIVMGSDGGDPDPDNTPQETDEYAELMKAANEGTAEEADAKN